MKYCLATMEGGMGLNAASRAFGIPKPTIWGHRLGLNKYASDDVKCMGGTLSLPPPWRINSRTEAHQRPGRYDVWNHD